MDDSGSSPLSCSANIGVITGKSLLCTQPAHSGTAAQLLFAVLVEEAEYVVTPDGAA
jgi:hypothetical protein